jgi:hypothetical protein
MVTGSKRVRKISLVQPGADLKKFLVQRQHKEKRKKKVEDVKLLDVVQMYRKDVDSSERGIGGKRRGK